MTKIKVGINAFGRIGRNVFKIALERPNIEIIGINYITSTNVLAHLLKYDSTQGKLNGEVDCTDDAIIVKSLIPIISMFGLSKAILKTFLPIRPNPLIPTLIFVMTKN